MGRWSNWIRIPAPCLPQYGPDGARGLAVDTLTDHIFYSSDEGIMRLNPFTGEIRRFTTLRADGMAFTGDGTLWTLSWPDRGELIKWDRRGPHQVVLTLSGGADGIAVGQSGSAFAGKLIVNQNDGTVVLIDPQTLDVTTLASGGSRGDFVKSGPRGEVYVTQSDQIVVIDGSKIPPQVISSTAGRRCRNSHLRSTRRPSRSTWTWTPTIRPGSTL